MDEIDFALSYAGEDEAVARDLDQRLRELGFITFFASDQRHLVAGAVGTDVFARLFEDVKVVVVFISDAYLSKRWTRLEWEFIRGRPEALRYIPVRLEMSADLPDLPDNILYVSLDEGVEPVVAACVSALLEFEEVAGIDRPSEYRRILASIRANSKGSLAKAFRLAKDQRRRDPLDDIEVPADPGLRVVYRVLRHGCFNFSVVRRLEVRIVVPMGLSLEELRYNLRHCCATQFNVYKPDAVSVLAYVDHTEGSDVEGACTAGRVELAPFGDWGKAQDGVAYNLPTSDFEYTITIAPGYLD